MPVIIRILELATGERTDAEGQFVQEYTPDGNDGRGDLLLTGNAGQAKRYPNAVAALRDWKRVSETHPVRLDGKPNRPMTAFTIRTVNVAE